MHIPDGFLPVQVCLGGYGITGLLTWYSLRSIDREPDPAANIPKASLLAATFFVASAIRIPIPPASVHLVLNGALGAVLGFYAFPAILIGLFFQALVFGHGGLSTLGINAVMIGGPALISAQIFQVYGIFESWWGRQVATGFFAFLAGACGVGLASLAFFAIVIMTIPAGFDVATEQAAIYALMVAHIPLILLEGIFTTSLTLFLQRVKPEMLNPSQGSRDRSKHSERALDRPS